MRRRLFENLVHLANYAPVLTGRWRLVEVQNFVVAVRFLFGRVVLVGHLLEIARPYGKVGHVAVGVVQKLDQAFDDRLRGDQRANRGAGDELQLIDDQHFVRRSERDVERRAVRDRHDQLIAAHLFGQQTAELLVQHRPGFGRLVVRDLQMLGVGLRDLGGRLIRFFCTRICSTGLVSLL